MTQTQITLTVLYDGPAEEYQTWVSKLVESLATMAHKAHLPCPVIMAAQVIGVAQLPAPVPQGIVAATPGDVPPVPPTPERRAGLRLVD
jgi:hypothetical protein